MTSKIDKLGLGEEVRRLSDMGLGVREIATGLNRANNDVSVSHMAIQRFLHSDKVREIQKDIVEGSKPEELLRTEFRDKMYDLDDETHIALKESKNLYKEALEVLDKAKNSDNANAHLMALKTANDNLRQRISTLEQIRKDWHTLVESGYRTLGGIQEAKEVNYIQVNNMLVAFSKELCNSCRSKIVNLITQEEDSDGR